MSGGLFALADWLGVLAAPYESASHDRLSLDINSPKPKRNELRGRRTPEP